jgi:hypothetical protein
MFFIATELSDGKSDRPNLPTAGIRRDDARTALLYRSAVYSRGAWEKRRFERLGIMSAFEPGVE